MQKRYLQIDKTCVQYVYKTEIVDTTCIGFYNFVPKNIVFFRLRH